MKFILNPCDSKRRKNRCLAGSPEESPLYFESSPVFLTLSRFHRDVNRELLPKSFSPLEAYATFCLARVSAFSRDFSLLFASFLSDPKNSTASARGRTALLTRLWDSLQHYLNIHGGIIYDLYDVAPLSSPHTAANARPIVFRIFNLPRSDPSACIITARGVIKPFLSSQ